MNKERFNKEVRTMRDKMIESIEARAIIANVPIGEIALRVINSPDSTPLWKATALYVRAREFKEKNPKRGSYKPESADF